VNIAFIGHGRVGGALADHMRQAGHRVTITTSDPASASVEAALAQNPDLQVAAAVESLPDAEVVVLATPFGAVESVIADVGHLLAGKLLIDCTNPVGPGLAHGLGDGRSGSELIQSLLPDTKVVKAFSIYGAENLADSAYPGYGVPPAMLFCGDDHAAKSVAAGLIAELGWRPIDVGGLAQALHLEHMTLLWVRMVRVDGHPPNFVWAMLER
jgi:predicted dinucleotide-binding enzyme